MDRTARHDFLCDNTTYVYQRSFSRVLCCRRERYTPAMQQLFDTLPSAFAQPDYLKDGDTQTVIRLTIDNNPLVVKRYNTPTFLHRIKRLLRTSRAARTWYAAHLFQSIGLVTPEPIAFIEKRFGPFKSLAWYFYTYTEGTTLLDYFESGGELDDSIKQAVLNCFETLAQQRVSHGDMKATNILIHAGTLSFIDFDATSDKEAGFEQRLGKDLQRFLKNWATEPKLHSAFVTLFKSSEVLQPWHALLDNGF